MLRSVRHLTPPEHGWRLALKQVWDDERLDPRRRPVVIVPGYGMNSFIFGFHPEGPSLEAYLAGEGFEVWSADLRGQGDSRPDGPRRDASLAELALDDLATAIAWVETRTRSEATGVDAIGCSLGGTLVYAYRALVADHRLGSIVAIGAPLRWVHIHPLLRLAFSSPRLLSRIRLRYTRQLARVGLPLLRHAPWLLGVYLHPGLVDLSQASTLARTVEDPDPRLNAEIARWIRRKDLVLRGDNVTDGLLSMDNPLLVLTANADGIVPPATARFPLGCVASPDRTYIEVGGPRERYAHADLYISHEAARLVFAPIAQWLAARA